MGRGSSGAGGGGGSGVNPANIKNETSLVSERPYARIEVDEVLTAAERIRDEYGSIVGDWILADVVGKDSGTMAYSDGTNIGFNRKYFENLTMSGAYDSCVQQGFHPSRGNKSGMEAVAYHEFGHVLSAKVAEKLGLNGSTHAGANEIMNRARAATKARGVRQMAAKISGYAKTNNAEAVAEAFCDVMCNGNNAKAESRAIVTAMNNILK